MTNEIGLQGFGLVGEREHAQARFEPVAVDGDRDHRLAHGGQAMEITRGQLLQMLKLLGLDARGEKLGGIVAIEPHRDMVEQDQPDVCVR